MNKLFTKITSLALGAAMMIGVGVSVAANGSKTQQVNAANYTGSFVGTSDITTLTEGDIILIVNNNNKAMSNSNGTGSAPSATSVTVSNNTITNPSDTLIWTFGKSGSNYTFLAGTSGSNYLYCTNSNNGVRVGTNSNKEFTVDSGYLKNVATSRYVGVYNNSDWRCYTSSGGNIANQTFKYYKLQSSKTLSGISVATAPTKTVYVAGEHFDPTGLVITRTYSDSTSDTYTYADHTSDFTFSPTTTTALTTSNTSVTITYGEKSCSQAITVNAPKTPVSVASAGQTSTFDSGDTFIYDGTLTVTYENAGGSATVSPTSFKIGDNDIDPTSAGTVITPNTTVLSRDDHNGKTVYVLYEENNTTVYTSYVITVNKVTSVTFDATKDTGTSPLSKGSITFACSNGALNNNSEYRLYKNSVTTFTSSGDHIGQIDFEGVSGNPASGFAEQEGWTTSGDDGRWVGDADSVSFTASGAQVRATKIIVHFVSNEPSVEVSPTSIDLKTNDTVGVTVTATVKNVETPTYSWVKSNNNIVIEETENDNIIIVKPNIESNDTSKVTLTVGGATPALDPVEINVTISIPGPGETADTAFTVAEAKSHIDEVITGGESSGNDGNYYYATGIISSIYSSSVTSSGQISYYISADGTSSGIQLEAYNGKGLNGAAFTSIDDIAIGDTVIIYGQLKKYSSTYEFEQNNYLVSQTKLPKVNSIDLTPTIVTVEPDQSGNITELFTSIVINQDVGSTKTVNDIVWTSEDENVCLIEDGQYIAGDHGTSTSLNATIDGKVYGTATFNVIDPEHPFIVYDEPISFTKATSISVGDSIVFVHETSSVELSGVTTTGTTYGSVTEYGTNPTGSYILNVVAGNNGNDYAFETVDNTYLSWSSGNSLTTTDTITDSSSWTIDSNHDGQDGDWKFANVATTSRILQYNSGSPRFACYGNDNQAVFQIYKKTGGGTATLDLDDTILNLVKSKMSTYEDEHGNEQYGIAMCDYYGQTKLVKSEWLTMGSSFTTTIIDTYKLAYARSNREGNEVEKFLSAYDWVVENYGEDFDFLGRVASGKIIINSGERLISTSLLGGNTSTTVIIIVSVIGVSALGGFFFLRKRKEI